jgi:hypothetical protein
MALLPALLLLRPQPLPAADDVAFGVVFGIFVVALLAMIVVVITWAVRRDRSGRAAWRQQHQDGNARAEGDVPPPAQP